MNISINQLLPISNDPDSNLKMLVETLERNVKEGVKLCIFPEDYLYGVLRRHEDLIRACEHCNENVKMFQELARRYQVDLIPGTFPRYEDGKIYNSTVYINSSGEILTHYSKRNLWLAEREEYEPSLQAPEVFEGILGKTAIIICWDILDHQLFRLALEKDAEWVICLAFWSVNQSEDMARKRGTANEKYRGYSDSNFLTDLVPTRAVEYGINIIFCNFGGIHEYMGMTGVRQQSYSAGRSQVATPRMQQYSIIRHRKPEVLIADINSTLTAKELCDAEIIYGRRKDVRRGYPYAIKEAAKNKKTTS